MARSKKGTDKLTHAIWKILRIDAKIVRRFTREVDIGSGSPELAEARLVTKLAERLRKREVVVKYGCRGESRWRMISKEIPQSVKSFLDFGGGDGSTAKIIGDKLGLPAGAVRVVDCDIWQNIRWSIVDGVEFTATDALSTLPTGSVDLIMASHVLHHIKPDARAGILGELGRILSPGGMFVLYEHDCDSRLTKHLLDTIHLLYSVLLHRRETLDEFKKEYVGEYMSAEQWSAHIVQSAGLRPISAAHLGNLSRCFYAYFVKGD